MIEDDYVPFAIRCKHNGAYYFYEICNQSEETNNNEIESSFGESFTNSIVSRQDVENQLTIDRQREILSSIVSPIRERRYRLLESFFHVSNVAETNNTVFRLYGMKRLTPLYFTERDQHLLKSFCEFISKNKDIEIRLLKKSKLKTIDVCAIDADKMKIKIKNLDQCYKNVYID